MAHNNQQGRFDVTRPEAAQGGNQMERRAPSRPQALGTRPRRSVALQNTQKHARKKRTSYAVRD